MSVADHQVLRDVDVFIQKSEQMSSAGILSIFTAITPRSGMQTSLAMNFMYSEHNNNS